MRERVKKKNNVIIGGLLAIVLLMTVGYAAFASNLSITSTASTTNNWKVLITNIESKDIVGGASNISSSYDTLTANFQANLTAPGDSITYEVTVTNQGTLDAVLSSIQKNITTNEYIEVTTSGVEEGQILYSNSSRVLKVVIKFKDGDIGSLTGTNSINISLTLNYSQNTSTLTDNKEVTILYYPENGDEADSVQLNLKDAVLLPSAPTYLGYEFKGWYTDFDEDYGYLIEPGTLVADVINDLYSEEEDDTYSIYALYNQNKYTVNYDAQGGTAYNNHFAGLIWEHDYRALSNGANWDGHTFDGWYTSPNGGGMKLESTTHLGDLIQYVYGTGNDKGPNGEKELTLYANWI